MMKTNYYLGIFLFIPSRHENAMRKYFGFSKIEKVRNFKKVPTIFNF